MGCFPREADFVGHCCAFVAGVIGVVIVVLVAIAGCIVVGWLVVFASSDVCFYYREQCLLCTDVFVKYSGEGVVVLELGE